jgi:hypothetical protein
MRLLGRAVLLLLAAIVIVASLPPGFDEDRSVAGFCSPDCLLQQDAAAHSVAVTPPPSQQSWSFGYIPERARASHDVTPVTLAAPPDSPRAPPRA